MSERVLVTGGLGFIGSAFVRHLAREGREVVNVDAGTYAADEQRIAEAVRCLGDHRIRTSRIDVASPAFAEFVRRERPSLIVHLAAETHVTRSEWDEERFTHSNVEGTRTLLMAAETIDPQLIVHVSTDEIYGPCAGPPFRESDAPADGSYATSTYARSKAVADNLVRSFFRRLPLIVVRPTNCFGPWQHPEKAIPRWITRALTGHRLPVWGDGMQVRDWMYVDDAVAGLAALAERGSPGEVYNLAPEGPSVRNIEMARAIARAANRSDDAVYLTEYDRPLHDRRYAINASKIKALGWGATKSIEERLMESVEWYRGHMDWWGPLVAEAESLYGDVVERAHHDFGQDRRGLPN